MHIAFFDSGVGGLSILKELRTRINLGRFSYLADNAHFPYGARTQDQINLLTCQAVSRLAHHDPFDLLVVACNTASTVVLDELRSMLSCPIIGVVPAIKPAAAISQTKVFGLLATRATVEGHYVETLLSRFAADCTCHRLGSDRLVRLAEEKMCGVSPNHADVIEILKPLLAIENLDTLVLGCTHFPLLREEIAKACQNRWQLLCSTAAICRRVNEIMLPAFGQKKTQDSVSFYYTALTQQSQLLVTSLLKTSQIDTAQLLPE